MFIINQVFQQIDVEESENYGNISLRMFGVTKVKLHDFLFKSLLISARMGIVFWPTLPDFCLTFMSLNLGVSEKKTSNLFVGTSTSASVYHIK
jgi:hypothetical protein